MVIAFTGVVIIGYSKRVSEEQNSLNTTPEDPQEGRTTIGKFFGVILSIIAAWAFAFNAVYNRKLKAIPARVILFYHGIIGMIGTGIYWIIEAIVRKQIRTYSW